MKQIGFSDILALILAKNADAKLYFTVYCQTQLLAVTIIKTKPLQGRTASYLFHTSLNINFATNRPDGGEQEKENLSAGLHVFQTSPLILAALSKVGRFDLSRRNFPFHVILHFI